jgi:hypothetical protein
MPGGGGQAPGSDSPFLKIFVNPNPVSVKKLEKRHSFFRNFVVNW